MIKRDVIDQCNYLGKILLNTGGWKKQKASVRATGYEACVASDKCVPVQPNIKVKGKGKAIPLQFWTGPEGSRRLRHPDFYAPCTLN